MQAPTLDPLRNKFGTSSYNYPNYIQQWGQQPVQWAQRGTPALSAMPSLYTLPLFSLSTHCRHWHRHRLRLHYGQVSSPSPPPCSG
jgi:hypothetical protein